MKRRRLLAAGAMALALVASIHGIAVAQGPGEPPTGQLTWGLHFSPTPTLYEPAETPGLITPFMFLYALHDALAKPMPGKSISPSLAESWTASPDGLVYEFVLRKGVRFHNGDPVTAEDVKYSFERYRGISAKALKDRTAAVEVVDAGRVRFRLKQPWADFLTFYATPATGAAWIVPKKYVEKVGEEGFKKAPIGAGPYRFVSFNPGVELVLEAFDGYWRKTPSVKRLVFKSVPDPATRLAMLKTGEADIAYGLAGEIGEEVRRTSGLTLPRRSRAPTGSSLPISGIRLRPGTTGASGWRLPTPSTGRRSTRPRTWASRRSPGASSPSASTSTGSRRQSHSTRPRPSSFWPRPATRRASTPGTSGVTPPPAVPRRPRSTICRRPGSRPGFGRSSGPDS